MKTWILISILAMHVHTVNAICTSNDITVFPSSYMMSQNSKIILTGYASSQNVINGLNSIYPVYLEGNGQKIKLLVVEKYVGGLELTQAVLKPESEPQLGKEYTLRIDNIDIYDIPHRYNQATKSYETPSYFIVNDSDNEKPKIDSLPTELRKSYIRYGCGPATYVTFSLPVTDKSEFVIKTTVYNLKTGKASTYYVEPYKNEIAIGHSMCSGEFTFGDYTDFEVTFAFMDVSGNTTGTTPPIRFTAPKKDGEED